MAIITPASMADLVAGTLKKFQRDKWEQIMQTVQQHVTVGQWFEKEKVMMADGYAWQHSVAINFVNTARWVGLFAEDAGAVYDHLQTISVNWATIQNEWYYDYTETLMNKGESLITNIIQPREANCTLGMAETIETQTWTEPATTDTDKAWGVPYWVVYNGTDGFTGTVATGHTTVGGINPSTYTNWKNYSATYTDITKASLIRKLKAATARKLRWRSPNSVSDHGMRGKLAKRYKLYTTDVVMSQLEDGVLEAQESSLGVREAAPATVGPDGSYTITGFPVIYVPALETAAASGSDPVYAIDHDSFFVLGLRGNWFRSEGPFPKRGIQSDVWETFKKTTFQFVCINRRTNAIIAKADPYA